MSRNFSGNSPNFAVIMKNKTVSLLLVLGCLFANSLAYSSTRSHERSDSHKNWQLNANIGTSIDLMGNSSNPNSGLLSTRPSAVPSLNFRIARYLSPRVGLYTTLHMNFYEETKSEYLNSTIWGDFVEGFFNEIFWPVSQLKPAIDAGAIYRIEKGKWNMSTSLGVGYMCYLNDRDASVTSGSYPGNVNSMTYSQKGSTPYANIGLSVNYFISRRCFIGLNADFQQPLGNVSAEQNEYENSILVNKISYQSSTAGRNLNFGIGFGFTF